MVTDVIEFLLGSATLVATIEMTLCTGTTAGGVYTPEEEIVP